MQVSVARLGDSSQTLIESEFGANGLRYLVLSGGWEELVGI